MEKKALKPQVILIAGPNGVGKSTIAPTLLRDALSVNEFVNADVIARGLAGFEPEKAAFQAGRVMLERLKQLVNDRQSFAFETTLASRSFAPWLSKLKKKGYITNLVYIWLPSSDLCVKRVNYRVKMGGHHIPKQVIQRRYNASIKNFFTIYQKAVDNWYLLENLEDDYLKVIAYHEKQKVDVINKDLWNEMNRVKYEKSI